MSHRCFSHWITILDVIHEGHPTTRIDLLWARDMDEARTLLSRDGVVHANSAEVLPLRSIRARRALSVWFNDIYIDRLGQLADHYVRWSFSFSTT